MAGLKLEITGLEALRERLLPKKVTKVLVPAINIEILAIHKFLEFEIVKQYTFPSDKRLGTVLKGKSASSLKQGANFLEQGLEYESKPVRLAEFPLKTITVAAKSRFFYKHTNGSFVMKKKNTAEAVQVLVKRSNGYKTVVGNGYGGFLQRRDTSGVDKYTGFSKPIRNKNNIYQRQQKATWLFEPIARAPIQALYGPSLSFIARSIFNKNSTVLTEKFSNNIAKVLSEKL